MEAAMLRSRRPVEVAETEEVEVRGERGLYLNRTEVKEWRGDLDIGRYELNEDSDPELIVKVSAFTHLSLLVQANMHVQITFSYY